jgi:predicted metal-dependent HD superfamily phosphohydrolase
MNLNTLLEKYKIKANLNMLLEMWNEPHRSYHNLNHLVDLTNMINIDYANNKINQVTTEKLLLTSLFHDIIYDPTRTDNEAKSAEFFLNLCTEKKDIHILDIKQAILDTATHTGDNYLSERFNKYDMNIVERDFDSLLEWEKGIWFEYSNVCDKKAYKEGRTKFLESIVDKYPLNSANLSKLVEMVKNF